MTYPANGRIWIFLSLLCGLILALLPLPAQLDPWRPDWVALILGYWCLALPHRINVGTAWIMGFLLDNLLGSILGVRALAFSCLAFFMCSQFQLLRNLSIWQQSLVVGLLSLFGKLIVIWIEHLFSQAPLPFSYLASTLTSMLLWPWIFFLLRHIRRTLHVM